MSSCTKLIFQSIKPHFYFNLTKDIDLFVTVDDRHANVNSIKQRKNQNQIYVFSCQQHTQKKYIFRSFIGQQQMQLASSWFLLIKMYSERQQILVLINSLPFTGHFFRQLLKEWFGLSRNKSNRIHVPFQVMTSLSCFQKRYSTVCVFTVLYIDICNVWRKFYCTKNVSLLFIYQDGRK